MFFLRNYIKTKNIFTPSFSIFIFLKKLQGATRAARMLPTPGVSGIAVIGAEGALLAAKSEGE